MKTDKEIQQHCDESGLGKWAWAACEGANCTGGGVIEDIFDGLCRWCSCEQERPTDPADMPPPMRAEAEEWKEWLVPMLQRQMLRSYESESTQ
jgi:hypothetical protein